MVLTMVHIWFMWLHDRHNHDYHGESWIMLTPRPYPGDLWWPAQPWVRSWGSRKQRGSSEQRECLGPKMTRCDTRGSASFSEHHHGPIVLTTGSGQWKRFGAGVLWIPETLLSSQSSFGGKWQQGVRRHQKGFPQHNSLSSNAKHHQCPDAKYPKDRCRAALHTLISREEPQIHTMITLILMLWLIPDETQANNFIHLVVAGWWFVGDWLCAGWLTSSLPQ